MGTKNSKKVDYTGEIINTVVVQPVNIESKEILIMLYVLVTLKVFEVIYMIYKDHKRSLKRRYRSEPRL